MAGVRLSFATMASKTVLCWLVGGLVLGQSWGTPVFFNRERLLDQKPLKILPFQSEGTPLTLVSELTSRLSPHPARVQEASRLPLPTPQDLEAIRKVAQILVMLGQQVIPAIIGEPQTSPTPGEVSSGDGIPNDPVTLDKLKISS